MRETMQAFRIKLVSQRSAMLIFLAASAFALVLGTRTDTTSGGMAYLIILLVIYTMIQIASSAEPHWHPYEAALPLTRRALVQADYLYSGCMAGLMLLVIVGIWLTQMDAVHTVDLFSNLMSFGSMLMLLSVIIPVLYLAGRTWGRLTVLVFVCAYVLLMTVSVFLTFSAAINVDGTVGEAAAVMLTDAPQTVIVFAVGLVLYPVSCAVSCAIYEKKRL